MRPSARYCQFSPLSSPAANQPDPAKFPFASSDLVFSQKFSFNKFQLQKKKTRLFPLPGRDLIKNYFV